MNNLPVVRLAPPRIPDSGAGVYFLYADVNVGDLPFNSSKLVTVWVMVDALVWRAFSGYRHDERSGTKLDNCTPARAATMAVVPAPSPRW